MTTIRKKSITRLETPVMTETTVRIDHYQDGKRSQDREYIACIIIIINASILHTIYCM